MTSSILRTTSLYFSNNQRRLLESFGIIDGDKMSEITTAKQRLEKEGMKLKGTPETKFEEKRKAGLAHKAIHDGELIEFGEPDHEGKRRTRPKSIGCVYDIPPNDGTYCEDQVDQTAVDTIDINNLMAAHDPSGKAFSKAIAQGMVTEAGMRFDDFSRAPSFQEALDTVVHAREQFATLDAKTRARFENDPAQFMAYIEDPNTLEEQYKLGFRVKKVEPEKDMTIKELAQTIQATAKAPKKGPRGGEGEE